MLIPIRDDNPLRLIRFQVVTAAIIVLNVIAFFLTSGFSVSPTLMSMATGFGVVPVELFNPGQTVSSGFNPVSEPITLITYQFLHGGWMHLISNMLFLWILADNVEDAFGHYVFPIFYLLCGIAGALTHSYFNQASDTPLIGASGALAGVIGAYVLLYPGARITTLLGFVIPIRVPAWLLLGGWLVLQFVSLYQPQAEGQAVAFLAHIGGFVAGLVLALAFKGFFGRTYS